MLPPPDDRRPQAAPHARFERTSFGWPLVVTCGALKAAYGVALLVQFRGVATRGGVSADVLPVGHRAMRTACPRASAAPRLDHHDRVVDQRAMPPNAAPRLRSRASGHQPQDRRAATLQIADLFPRSRFTDAQRQEFLHSTIGLFPVGLPAIYPDAVFICFEDGWVPRCLSCQAAPLWFRMERASGGPLRAYQSILSPVFSRLHIQFTPPSAAPFMTFLAISAVLLVWAFAVEASMQSLVGALARLAGLVLLTSGWQGVLTGRA
jgi:hypothetical protein